MPLSRLSPLYSRMQRLAFVVLWLSVMGLAAFVSTRYTVEFDWTAGARNTLAAASRRVLTKLTGPVHVTAFASHDPMLRRQINNLLGRYRRYKHDFTVRFVDPATAPDETRKLGITEDGELLLAYGGRTEQVKRPTEQALTNGLLRLARGGQRWIAYLTGHGERDLLGRANYDLGTWGHLLEQRGFKPRPLNLAQAGSVPANVSVLVIAGAQANLLPGEVRILQHYIAAGGDLLWLTDPGPHHGLEPLARSLGVSFEPGVVIDPEAQVLGLAQPTFVVVTDYPRHPVTRGFHKATLFPKALALQAQPTAGWKSQPLLETNAAAWDHAGPPTLTPHFEQGVDIRGPLTIGLTLTRPAPASGGTSGGTQRESGRAQLPGGEARTQRVAIIGDGDFLSNAYIGNGGNLDLGMNLISWLSRNDELISIPAKTAPDVGFSPSPAAPWVIGLGSLIGVPVLLLGTGVLIWLRRRAR